MYRSFGPVLLTLNHRRGYELGILQIHSATAREFLFRRNGRLISIEEYFLLCLFVVRLPVSLPHGSRLRSSGSCC
uniref:RRM domain-containing protein n=1 Tax=Caenorhabditis tropicalis TaxID=1561998 RepID=A0A1I7U250_9PELO